MSSTGFHSGTSTLRRSAAVELAQALAARGVAVQAFDPAVRALPPELRGQLRLCASAAEALAGADLAVVATEWPEFRQLSAADFTGAMRRARVVDTGWFLAAALAAAPGLVYVAPGRATQEAS